MNMQAGQLACQHLPVKACTAHIVVTVGAVVSLGPVWQRCGTVGALALCVGGEVGSPEQGVAAWARWHLRVGNAGGEESEQESTAAASAGQMRTQ